MIGRAKTVPTILHLPLRRLGICLDCDECFEFGPSTCPACGSETLAPLARFLQPVAPLFKALNGASARPNSKTTRQLFVVARDRLKLYEYAKRAFAGNDSIEVILDRRTGDRRHQGDGQGPDRRRSERRRSDVTNQLRALGWAIVVLNLPRDLEPPPRPTLTRARG